MDQQSLLAIEKCLRYGCPFVAYSFPGSGDISFVANPSYQSGKEYGKTITIGFFGRDAATVDIYPELTAADVLAAEWDEAGFNPAEIEPWPLSTSGNDYLSGISTVVGILGCRGGKTVISRAITGFIHTPLTDIISSVFYRLDSGSFRFLYFTPATGAWAGASPELLLEQDTCGLLRTMALAGTMHRDSTDDWDLKNSEEHRMVVDYIEAVFRDHGLTPMVAPAETVVHGAVKHLRHIITADNSLVGVPFDRLIGRLSPTPALAGWPVETALAEIAATEAHPRHCYGGYISVPMADGGRSAYVNLRSFHFSHDRYCIYAGGGITARSIPADEWTEAENKSLPLRQILSHGG